MRRRAFLHTVGVSTLALTANRSAAQSSYGPLGRLSLDGITDVVVSENGTTAFVPTGTGFGVIDVRHPASPRILANRRKLLSDRKNGPLRGIEDVKVDGDRLLVVGPAEPTDAIHAMALYDVSDPANPELVGVHETAVTIHNGFITGDHVYLTQYNNHTSKLLIIDISDDDPEQVGEWSILDEPGWRDVPPALVPLHDMWIQDGTAYLAQWEAGAWILDVSDPRNPTSITHIGGRPPQKLARIPNKRFLHVLFNQPGNIHSTSTNHDGSILGVGVEATPPGGITLWNVETPHEPHRLAHIDPPANYTGDNGTGTTAHNFGFGNGRLYSSWYRGGVKVHDVSDPKHPRELTHWRRTNRTSFWAAQPAVPGEFFVASSWTEGGKLPQSYLYTFPDHAGESVDPGIPADVKSSNHPATTGRPPSPTDTNTSKYPTTSKPSNVSTSRMTASSRETTTSKSLADETSGGGGAGFGTLAAVLGIGLGAWRYLRQE